MEGKSKVKSQKSKIAGSEERLAVLTLGGGQYLIREGAELETNRLSLEEGGKEKVEVLLLKPKIGKGIAIIKLLEQKKGPKITVMKYKAKSRYRRKRGFRAAMSRIVVEKINGA